MAIDCIREQVGIVSRRFCVRNVKVEQGKDNSVVLTGKTNKYHNVQQVLNAALNAAGNLRIINQIEVS